MHTLLILDPRAGHVEVAFAPPEDKSKQAVETRKEAERIFNEVMARPGWSVIATVAPAEKEGATLKKFDPTVREAVAIPQTVGG